MIPWNNDSDLESIPEMLESIPRIRGIDSRTWPVTDIDSILIPYKLILIPEELILIPDGFILIPGL